MDKKNKFITRKRLSRAAAWMRTFGYFLSMAAFGLIGSSLGPVLPDLAAQVAVPIHTISIIFTARAGGFLIGSFLGGRIIDRYRGHLYLVVCFIAQAMILAFTPFVAQLWLLTAMLFASGITLGFVVVGASTYIVWEHTETPSPWVSAQSFFNGVGNFLSPLVISLVIINQGVYARSYWFYALLCIILAALFLYTPSPKIRKQESEPVSAHDPQVKNRRLVYLVALIFLFYTGAEVTYNGWVFTMATTAYPLTATAGRLLNSLFWGALAIGRIFVGILSRRFQPSRILSVAFIGAVASFGLAIILPGSPAVLWVSSICAGLFMAVIFPTLTLYADKQMGLTGSMTGTFFMATSVGGMLLPWIAGQLFTLLNPHWVKVVVAASLMGGLLFFNAIEKTKNA